MSGGNAPWSETVWLLAKNVLFTILVPGVAGVYLPLRIAGGPIPLPAWGLLPVAGIVLLAFGTAGYLWCQWEFATFGRGTPAPIDPPKRLVIRGLHRYVRNPIYLSALTVPYGSDFMHSSCPSRNRTCAGASVNPMFSIAGTCGGGCRPSPIISSEDDGGA